MVDRRGDLVSSNAAAGLFVALADPGLVAEGLNVYRLGLHPDGLVAHVLKFAEYAGHVVDRLRRQVDTTADPDLAALLAEVQAHPGVAGAPEPEPGTGADVALPIRFRHPEGELTLFSTITVFGTPVDITVSHQRTGELMHDPEGNEFCLVR